MRTQRVRRQSPWVAAVVVVALVLLGGVAVRHYIAQPFRVPSQSMAPTLQQGDYILANRASRGTAERGELVVIDGRGYFGHAEGGGHYWVKRVIAVGGDDVRAEAGVLYLNGEELTEPYLAEGTLGSEINFHVRVPEGALFLLGDNRGDSTDSRSFLGAPGGGMVPEERVVGRVDVIVWPRDRAKSLKND